SGATACRDPARVIPADKATAPRAGAGADVGRCKRRRGAGGLVRPGDASTHPRIPRADREEIMTFRALLAEKIDGGYRVDLRDLDDADMRGEVLVDVGYSSLNYKDALAITARGKIIRKFPMVLGID